MSMQLHRDECHQLTVFMSDMPMQLHRFEVLAVDVTHHACDNLNKCALKQIMVQSLRAHQ